MITVSSAKQPTSNIDHGEYEFCIVCNGTLSYKWAMTHIDDPIRSKNGAYYTEGIGQTCAECANPKKEKT